MATNPQKVLQDRIKSFGNDNSKLTVEELSQKLELLNQLNDEKRGESYDVASASIGPGGIQNQTTETKYKPGAAVDNASEIKSIEDILASRNYEAGQNSLLEKTISDLPGQLGANTDQFVADQTQNADNFFAQELAPQIAQNSNQRGLLYSGDFVSELSKGAGDLQGTLDTTEADLRAQDQQFFADMAYQNTFRKAIQAQQDVSGDLTAARNNAANQKEMSFQSSQNDINRSFQEQLFRRQQQQALMAQQQQTKNQQDQVRKKNQSDMISGLSTSIGAIAGTAVAGPIGGAVGASIGNNTGLVNK